MKLFKLTDFRSITYRDTQWGKNVTHSVLKEKQGTELCSPGVIHAYKNLNLALLLNPIHSTFSSPKVWAAKGNVVSEDWGKVGCWKLTTLEQLNLPDWYTDEYKRKRVQVRFAILCAEKVLKYFEDIYPSDQRPRKAIEVAQDFLKATKTKKLGFRVADRNARAADDAAYDAAYDVGQKGKLISNIAAHIAASDAAHAAASAVGAISSAARAARAASAAYRITNKDIKLTIKFSTLADKAVSIEEEKQ